MSIKELVITADNQQVLEGGRIGYGRDRYTCRGGGYESYQVRLSAAAAAWAEVGDILRWWRTGPSDMAYQACGGEIVKADGRRIQLKGSMDLGIDTGHPPHLGLKMQQVTKPVWEPIWETQRSLLRHEASGVLFVKKLTCPPLGGLTIAQAREELELFQLPEIPKGQQPHWRWEDPYQGCESWREGYFSVQHRIIKEVDSDRPEIL